MHDFFSRRLTHRLFHWLNHRISALLTPILLLAVLVGCAVPPIAVPANDGPADLAPANVVAGTVMANLLKVSNTMADELSSGHNCLVTGEGTGFSSRGGGDGIPSDRVHGQYVWETMLKYLGQPINGVMASPLSDIEQGVVAELADPSTVISAGNLPVAIFVIDEFTNPASTITETDIIYNAPSQLYRLDDGMGNEHFVLMQAVDIEEFNMVQVKNDLLPAIASRKIDSLVSTAQPIELPPLQDFVLNMSWIIVPCSKLPEGAGLTDYFDSICRTTTQQEEEDLSKLADVIETLNNIADGTGTVIDPNNPAAPALTQLCDDLLAQSEFRTNLDLFGLNNLSDKLDIVSIFALRPYWLRGVYEEIAVEGMTPDLTRPQGNVGYEALNCLTFDPNFDIAEESDLAGDCFETRHIVNLAETDQVIPVAAGGNDGRPFPYLPAVWDSILSVGANNYKSNSAEIWMNGESTQADPVEFWKGGSSFAAPRMSVWAALYLATTRSARCLSDTTIRPVLGVKADWNLLDPSLKRLPLRDAAYWCPEFEDLVNTYAP